MTIAEIKEKLSQERGFGSRYPARIVFVENLDDYSVLEHQLKGICDVTMNVADFCRAPDTVPQFDQIKNKLKECEGQQVLLLSVGEYLRMCTKRELNPDRRQFRAFWETQQPEASKTRVVIPVFNCRDIFDRIIGAIDERQENYVWTLDSAPSVESYTVSVYSPKFKEAINPDADNLTSWFRDWQIILRRNVPCSVVTMQYGSAETAYGTVNIKPIDSPFRYLTDILVDGHLLIEKWQSNDFWSRVVNCTSHYAAKMQSFDKVVLDALKVNEFDFVSVAARWETLNVFQKNLVWLWYRVYPTDEYYSYACKKALCASDIPEKIRDEILLISNRSDRWIEERMAAVRALSFHSFDDAYFALMDRLPLDETKLKLLTYQTHEEKTYAVKVISNMLRGGAEPSAIAASLLERDYPSLASYMKDEMGCDDVIDEYMAWYRKNKIINRYPGDYPVQMTFDRFDARYKLMHKLQGKDCVSFWIDGFGSEYTPLFLHELKARGIVPESVKLATALLPTETEYNHQWDEHDPMTIKWDRLDSFSHKGMPDDKSYYSCIVHQLSVFSDAAKKVEELLENHEYVVVTGDHGSSRFAALAFHQENVVPISAPKKSTVRSFGRFCELDDNAGDVIALPNTVVATSNGKRYLVMDNYQHFSVSGNAAGGNTDEHDVVGEIHGGNTAEERLVSVIVIKRKRPLSPVTCKPKGGLFVTKKNGHVEKTLQFSRPISTLEVSYDNKEATCTMNADGSWLVILDGVTTDDITLSVIANGRLLPNVTLKVKAQGISKNDDLFGGMGL